jgi:endoglucanase
MMVLLLTPGNSFSMDFTGFDRVYTNSVYAVHDYCGFGFPNRIGRFQGHKDQEQYIRKMYDRKVEFMKKHNVPVWNGKTCEARRRLPQILTSTRRVRPHL